MERERTIEMKCRQTAQTFKGDFREYAPFPGSGDLSAYRELPRKLREEILAEGEKYLGFAYPPILATDYMRFKRTGNRVDFEDVYFTRRHALCALVLAECTEQEGRFLDDIINGVFVLCEESGWQLPPHNSYIRDEPQYILPDATRPVIDLFAAETGALLAWVHYLLGTRLDQVSGFITSRIRDQLRRRILVPYTTEHFWWMGEGEEPMCNWTPWCTQNVLLTAFLLPWEGELQRKVFLQAAASCDYFLKDYGEDGCCDEGAQYYRHAGLCLFGALDVLDYVSRGAFADLFAAEKTKNIAAYILNVHAGDKYYINFADCSAVPGRCGVREYLFGKATGQPALQQFAAQDFRAEDGRLYTGAMDQINLYYLLQTCFYYEEVSAYDNRTPLLPKDVYYESVGLFLARSASFCLGVKAGYNGDNHNHNDTGSFTLYKNGKPLFVDVGVESYTQKTFSPKRYEIWTMQSCYHNLPTLSGTEEKDGADYRAREVSVLLEGNTPGISMELAAAYPLPQGQVSYRRTVVLDKEKEQVTVTDATNCRDVLLNFITYEKPDFSEGVLHIGGLAECLFTGARLLALETLPITDPRLQKAWDHDLYRIRLTMTDTTFQLTIR